MMKLWVGIKNLYNGDDYVGEPDPYFDYEFDFENLLTDFSKEVMLKCSGGVVPITSGVLRRPNGMTIPPSCLSSGAKNVLCMKYMEDYMYEMVWCGENCESYVNSICNEKDVRICTSRIYCPFDAGGLKDGVLILNTGKVVYSSEEYFDNLDENDLW